MANEKIYNLDWGYDIWSDIESCYPVGTKLKCRVTRVQPHQAWLMSEEGVTCFLRKWQTMSRWQVTDLTEELSQGDNFSVTVREYNKEKHQLIISLDIHKDKL